jgi:hypothetical protein
VLSKLLKVTDGPANTLVITSLVDGSHVNASDLQIEFAIPTTVATNDVAAWNTAIGGIGWDASALQLGRELAFNQLIENKATTATGFGGLAASDLDNYGVNAGGDYSSWYTSNNNTGAAAGNTDYAAAFANDGTSNLLGTNSAHVSDNIINAGSGDDVIVLSTGSLSNDTIKWTDFNQGTNTIVNFDSTVGSGLGDDWLDFTSYGARWLGAATLDVDGHVAAATGWTTADDLHGAHATGGSTAATGLPSVILPTTPIFWEDYTVHAGDKYITLTRVYQNDDANSTVAGTKPHWNTVYKIELWTVNGNLADAYVDSGSLPTTEARDSSQLIGYVDLGKTIEDATGSDSILSHIDFIL